jgi:polar amino acid transport system substrate-binding protein
MFSSRTVKTVMLAATGVAVLTVTACASGGAAETSASPSADAESFTIPQQTGVPPWSYTDDADKLVGILPDMTVATGTYLGVGIENERTTWENSLLGLESGKYVFVPGADATPERLEKFDFAIAVQEGYGFKVKAGSPEIADDMSALCGLSVGLPTGSSPIQALEEASTECTTNGEDPIDIKTFPDWASADLAVQSGQVDAATAVHSAMALQASENPGVWTITGPTYSEVEIGFAVLKGSEWGPRLVDALNEMIANGEYSDILDQYSASSIAITESHLVTE